MTDDPNDKAVLGHLTRGYRVVAEHHDVSTPSHAKATVIDEAMQAEHVAPVRGTPSPASGQNEGNALLGRPIDSVTHEDEKAAETSLDELRQIWRRKKSHSGEG